MTTTHTKQNIRFATRDEELRYWRRHSGAFFTTLIVVETWEGSALRYNFLPFRVPRAIIPDLPDNPDVIRNIDAGRGVLIRRAGGYRLRGYAAEWSRHKI